jgi:hypothetical protein
VYAVHTGEQLMRDNYVAKNANKFNRGGAHPDRSKYSRSTALSKHGALDELDDDLALEYELERKADFDAAIGFDDSLSDSEYFESVSPTAEEMDWIFQDQEPLHFEDF